MSGTLAARGIAKSYGARTVLRDITLTIAPGDRIAIVGPNGAGKTTLLRILAGLTEPDTGTVVRSPRTLNVGWLPQEPDALEGETLLAYLARRTGVAQAEAEVDRLTEAMAQDPQAMDDYTEALERFLALGGDDLARRAEEVCASLGMSTDRIGVEMRSLSGGQRARAALAAVLLSRFDVLLLDEPTNDLDLDGLARLESFCVSAPAGIAVVSHDRAFLEKVVKRVLELDPHVPAAAEYGVDSRRTCRPGRSRAGRHTRLGNATSGSDSGCGSRCSRSGSVRRRESAGRRGRRVRATSPTST